MAVSSADVRSIFSLPASGSGAAKKAGSSGQATSKKPEGIPRELYALIGDSAPSLATQLAKPRLKQKPKLGGNAKTHWEWRPFTNPARKDALQLSHWAKVQESEDPDAKPYPFAKYNVPTMHFNYTSEEYNNHLEDQDWPRSETDYLFHLVHEYDQRWHVIYDRYDLPGSSRSMEDLKDRYFSACRKLVRARHFDDENSKIALLTSLQFDKEREMTRKKYIHSLESRTQDQKAEEEALYIELKRLEQNERKFRRDREELLRTLAGIESGLADTVEDDSYMHTLVQDLKRKKKGQDIETSAGPSSASQKRAPPKNAAYDAQHCITRVDPPTSSALVTKNAHTPAFLRSYKLPTPKTAVFTKVNDLLKEINVNPSRLVMPARDNCTALEGAIEAASALLEQKKLLDKLEYDISVLKERGNKSERGGTAGPSSVTPAAEPSEAMEVEESVDGGEVGEDDRAQSVLSTRSTRSRKKTRSGSISSVDTTQAKRQRRN